MDQRYTSLKNLVNQRRTGENVCFPILAIDALLEPFNLSRFKDRKNEFYTYMDVRLIPEKQIEINEWIHEKISDVAHINIISPFMDLTELAQAIATGNGYGNITRFSSTGAADVKPFLSREDITHLVLKIPDPEKDVYLLRNRTFSILKNNSSSLKKKILMGYVPGPFTLINQLIGPEAIMLFAKTSNSKLNEFMQNLLHKWIDYAVNVINKFVDYLIRAQYEVICILEPHAMNIESIHFSKFLVKPMNRVIKNVKDQKRSVIFHACGDTTKLFKAFARLERLDAFNLDEDVSLEYFAKILSKRMVKLPVIIGNYNNKNMFLEKSGILFQNTILMQLSHWPIEKEISYIPGTGCEITLLDVDPSRAVKKLKSFLKGCDPKIMGDLIRYIHENY
jgi:uroporphyrinogen-III decarboxylase